AKMLKQHGITPDCLEPDKTLQAKLRRAGFKVLKGSQELKPETYDVIYALNVFEHIEDDLAEMIELRKALKKGGSLMVYVPAYEILFSSMDKQVGHLRRYRTRGLKRLVKAAGLEVKELFYYDPVGFLAAFTYRFVGDDGVLTPTSVRLYDKYVFTLSKALHPISRKLVGKNAMVVAEKPKTG
ncbi:MAG: methyltransferase domain-containing protein, partial [Candidatus Saccharimonadales bacterium]